MSFTLSDSRNWARQFCRNAGDSSAYTAVNLDRSIQLAGDAWLRITKSSRVLGTLTLSSGNFNLPSPPLGWVPEFQMQQTLLQANTVISPYIFFTDYNEVLQAQFLNNNSGSSNGTAGIMTGIPRLFGYRNETEGICFPTPNQDYTLLVWFWKKFTEWTPGQAELEISTSNFSVDSVAVLSGGYYASPPTVTASGGSGSGATFAVGLSPTGEINQIDVVTQGTNYTNTAILVNGVDCSTITFDLPDDAMRIISSDGCEAYLQRNEQQNQNISAAAKESFITQAKQFKGRDSGGRGGNVLFKTDPDCLTQSGPYGNRGMWPYGSYYPVG